MAGGRGKVYELKARFSVDVDTTPVEVLDKRLASLERRLNNLDSAKAKVQVDAKGLDKVEESSGTTRENLDEIGSKRKRKPRVDSSDIDKLATKLEKLGKLTDRLESAKFGPKPDVDNLDAYERKIDSILKKAKSSQKQAFEIEYEAKLVGDDTLRKKAQTVQKDLDRVINRNQEIMVQLKGDKEMVSQAKKASMEMEKDFAKRAKNIDALHEKAAREMGVHFAKEAKKMDDLQERAAREMGVHFAKAAQKIKSEISTLDRAVSEMTKRRNQIEMTLDPSQAYREMTALQGSLRTMTNRAFKVMMEADNTDLRTKAAESHRILSQLGKEVAEARVKLKGQTEMNADINSIQRNLTELTSRPWEAEVDGDTTQAKAAFNALAAQARAQFSRAYRVEVRAEAEGFPEVAAQAAALKREALSLAQTRARMAVELDGVPAAIAGLVAVKRVGESVEGKYTMEIDTSRIASAAKNLFTFRGAAEAARGSVVAFGSHLATAQNSATTLSRGVFVAQQTIQAFGLALVAVAAIAAGPLVAGLGILVGAVASLAGGLGLIAAVAAPVISSLSNFKQNTEEAATAAKGLRTANQALAQAEQGVIKANQQVASTARQNAQAISQAVKAHEDAVRGVEKARQQYDQALQGVQDAEVQGEEQIQNAIEAHEKAVRGVTDAQTALGKAAQAITDAQVQAGEQVQQALRSQEMAVRGAASAQHDYESSIRATENASHDYALAQEATADSQRELTFATEDYNDALATEQQRLLGLNYDLEGLQLNQKQLALDMQEAQKQMSEATDPLERQQAALRLEELQLRQKEGVLAIDEAQRRLNDAQTSGTDELRSAYEGQLNASRGYRDAQYAEQQAAQGVTDAQYAQQQAYQGVQDAQYEVERTAQEVTKAQQNGNRGITEAIEAHQLAQRNLNDAISEEEKARLGIGKAQEQASRSVIDAQQRVLDAQQGIDDALRREQDAREGIATAEINASESMSNALQGVEDANNRLADAQENAAAAQLKFNAAAAKLPTDKVRELHDAGMALWDSWQAQTASAQLTLANFGLELMNTADTAMPYVSGAATNMTNAMIDAFNQVQASWGSTGVFNSLQIMLRDMVPISENLGIALGNALGGIINIFAQASPFILDFSYYIKDISDRFLEWTNSAEGRTEIYNFFKGAAPVAAALGKFIWDVGGALLSWSTQNPEGVATTVKGILSVLEGVLFFIGDVVQAFLWLNNTVPGLGYLVSTLSGIYLATRLIPAPIRQFIFWLIKLTPFGSIISGIGTAIWGLGAAFFTASVTIMGVTAPLWLVVAAIAAVAAAAYLIYQNWDTIGPYFWSVVYGIGGAIDWLLSYLGFDLGEMGKAISEWWTMVNDDTNTWGDVFRGTWGMIWDAIADDEGLINSERAAALAGWWSWFNDDSTTWGDVLGATWNWLWNAIADDEGLISSERAASLASWWSWFNDDSTTWGDVLGSTWGYIWGAIADEEGLINSERAQALADWWSYINDDSNSWGDVLWYTFDAIWSGIDTLTGGWLTSITDAFSTAVKTALDFLSTLVSGAASVLSYIPGQETTASALESVAASIDYYEKGGVHGGLGTSARQPRHIVWNEGMGNEAFIAEKGPERQNLGYLNTAASWFDAAVIPKDRGESRKAHAYAPMEEGGIAYFAAGGTTYDWVPEVAEHASEIYDKVGGGITYNTYTNHPEGFPERAPYSVDFWGPNGRGDSLQNYDWGVPTGDKIVTLAQGYPDFSYYIWNGTDSYDGSIAATDPHYDHVHVTWMGDIGLEGGGIGGFLRSLIDKLPDMPDIGDGMAADIAEGTGQMVRDGVVGYLKSFTRGTSASGGDNADNLALGQKMAEEYGWTGGQWDALKELWHRESNWNHLAENPESGAYGIPQSLPADKMASYGSDYRTNPATQIAWGLDYIYGRYTDPEGALAFHDANNSYALGGIHGGLGTRSRNAQQITWNEGMGNEAFIAEKGPSEANLGYLNTAASWFGHTIVPTQYAQAGYITDPTPAATPTTDETFDSATLANIKGLVQAVVDAGAPAPMYQAGLDIPVTERVTQIDKETTGNSAYFYGPNGEDFGWFYGDENAKRIGQAAESQPNFSYWVHKGRSNVPYFDNGYWEYDELKVVWAGSMQAFIEEMAQQGTTQQYDATNTGGNQYINANFYNNQGTVNGTPITSSLGAGLDSWITNGIAMGGVFSDDAATHQALYDRAMQESGGDPSAVNDWDSNAAAGTPSKGLMQIIQPTWDAYADVMTGYFEGNWSDPVKNVAIATRYMDYEYGGPVGASEYGYARGGIGGRGRDAHNIVWNEGMGNEAWISEDGSKSANLGYLSTAASWFDMGVIPMEKGGIMKGMHPYGKAGITGEGLGATHYAWSEEVQAYVNDIQSKFSTEANTYEGHGSMGGATEDMTADFWGIGGRGTPIDTATGDAVSSYIWDSLGGNLAYMIWGGNYYNYDGSIFPWPEDPHYDHVHASWGAGGWGGGHADNGLGASNMTSVTPTGTPAAKPLETYPDDYGRTGTGAYASAGGVTATGGTTATSTSNTNQCHNMETLSKNQGVLNDSMKTVTDNQAKLNTNVNSSGVVQKGPFTANTENVQTGTGKQSATSGAITQTVSAQEQQMAADTRKMASDPASGMPAVAGGLQDVENGVGGVSTDVTGMNTDMNSGLSGIDSSVDQLNTTMTGAQGCMCDAASQLGSMPVNDASTANQAVGTSNGYRTGYGTGSGSNTATNIATNQAVDSYTDIQNTGKAQGRGSSLNVGGQQMARDDAQTSSTVSPETAYLGSKVDKLTDATYEANEETELGSDSLEQIVRGAVAAALGVISSKGGRDIIDESLAGKMDFDTEMKGLGGRK